MIDGYDMWLGTATMLIVSIAIATCLVWALVAQRPDIADGKARGRSC